MFTSLNTKLQEAAFEEDADQLVPQTLEEMVFTENMDYRICSDTLEQLTESIDDIEDEELDEHLMQMSHVQDETDLDDDDEELTDEELDDGDDTDEVCQDCGEELADCECEDDTILDESFLF